eukprot:CAMPEP_0184858158 /NCGR_PEP_ID=MMETSP0580-20130426/3276_1 /TAXON_ID=1118495 /ORGANISM="Dactyliosolen fragilissimus" /LENGTH=180 /DNA_ID=CAMNT_0027354141 /DNA_START=265 /DNA_END=807 /DNA_ORIENTATION=-
MQHEAWVKFQQKISVEGFDTGQTTSVSRLALTGKKGRGGKATRKKRERELALAKAKGSSPQIGSGQFPSFRLADEETDRLLAEAYAGIPARAGPRRNRSLKRQKWRWWRVRKDHAIKKQERIRAHEKRMEKRSRITKEVKEVKTGAHEIRESDKAYREGLLLKWAELNNLLEEKKTSNEN